MRTNHRRRSELEHPGLDRRGARRLLHHAVYCPYERRRLINIGPCEEGSANRLAGALYQQGRWKDLVCPRSPHCVTGGMSGNPPAMLLLKDGRLCITYGFRGDPYGIRAVLSNDAGRTWGEEIIFRSDGAAWDIGYTRSAQTERSSRSKPSPNSSSPSEWLPRRSGIQGAKLEPYRIPEDNSHADPLQRR